MEILEKIKELEYHNLEYSKKLFEMHDIKDEDGVYMWYVKASIARSIDRLGKSVEMLITLLKGDDA